MPPLPPAQPDPAATPDPGPRRNPAAQQGQDTGQDMGQTNRQDLDDPVHESRALLPTESRVAIAGHPLHAMLVAFPVALGFCVLGADLLYWWTADAFWPRAAGWAAFGAFVMGMIAGITGTVELLIVPGIRNRSASWTHFVLAVMLLSLMGLNWWLRIGQPEAAVLPVGLLLSLVVAGLTAVTGWHGGKLVFDYQIGTSAGDKGRPRG